MTAEVFGARRMIFVKDVDGLYDRDPAVAGERAVFIPEDSWYPPFWSAIWQPCHSTPLSSN